jgi:hypothetical protein
MTDGPDLFAASEPKTCGNCAAFQEMHFAPGHFFCDLSLKDAEASADGCSWHYPREQCK